MARRMEDDGHELAVADVPDWVLGIGDPPGPLPELPPMPLSFGFGRDTWARVKRDEAARDARREWLTEHAPHLGSRVLWQATQRRRRLTIERTEP